MATRRSGPGAEGVHAITSYVPSPSSSASHSNDTHGEGGLNICRINLVGMATVPGVCREDGEEFVARIVDVIS